METTALFNEKTKRFLRYVPLIFAFCLNVWVLVTQYWLVDSDMSQEMLLAEHLVKTGKIISKDWYYTTELRVYNIHTFFKIFLRIFPNNWQLVRIFASSSIYLLYLASIYMLFSVTGNRQTWVYAGTLLMLPMSSKYWFLGIFGLGYVFYAAHILIIITCVLSKRKPLWIVGAILSFLLGLNGVKMILFLFAPLTATAVLVLWKKPKKNVRYALLSLGFSFASAIGLLITHFRFEDYHFYKYADTTFIGTSWSADIKISEFFDKIIDLVALLGYQGGAKVFSLYGFGTIVFLLVVFFIVFECMKPVIKNHKNNAEKYVMYVLISIIAIDTMAFTLLSVEYNSSYWIPCFALLICFGIMQLKENKKSVILIIACCAFMSFVTLKRNIELPLRGRRGLQEVATWLANNGYKTGYAQFWDADASTEFTSGKLEIWAVSDINNLDNLSWGQAYDHFSIRPEKPFVIVKKSELAQEGTLSTMNIIYDNEYYYVLK